jgi:hypothetical protein
VVPGGRALRTVLRTAAPAVLAYAAVRLLGLAVLAGWSRATGKSAHQLLSARWDSLWYTRIAEHGYGYTLHLGDGRVHSNLAFFPLLPVFERLMTDATPLGSADAGLVVGTLASLCAAWGIFEVGRRLYSSRVGIILAVLWGALPVGIVQSMAYTEALFTALAAWSLYAVLTARWVRAGLLALLAGLTRPVGAAVVAAVWCAAAMDVFRTSGGRRETEPRIPLGQVLLANPRLLLGVLIAPLGWFGYVVYVGVRTGSPTGYLTVQGQWGNGFDGGRAFAGFIWHQLTGPVVVAGVGLVVVVALLAWLYALCVGERQPLALLVYTGVVLLLSATGSGYFGSRPRLLLPAFPVLLPIALALARVRTARTAVTLGSVALASAVYGAFWLNGSGPP